MNMRPFSRTQRRKLDRLSREVDRLIETDRKFFERWPFRRHRIRRAFAAETAVREIVSGSYELSPGDAWFVAVQFVHPGVRLRAYFTGPSDLEADVSEAEAQRVYSAVGLTLDVIKNAMTSATSAGGGA